MDADDRTQDLEHLQLYPLAEQVSRALAGAVFPLTREELVLVARENEAPSTFLSLLHGMPRRSYRTLDGVSQAIEDLALASLGR